jgi:hypothetical protein
MDEKEFIKLHIKSIRRRLGLTQVQMGRLVWPGDPDNLTQSRVAKYLAGTAMVPTATFLRIHKLSGLKTINVESLYVSDHEE